MKKFRLLSNETAFFSTRPGVPVLTVIATELFGKHYKMFCENTRHPPLKRLSGTGLASDKE